MAFAEYAKYDGLGLAALVAKKKIKPIELLDEAIARAEALNPKLNAIIYKDYDRARIAAKGKLPKGAFTGVPFLLKDIMAFAQGMPTRQGSQFIPPIPWPPCLENPAPPGGVFAFVLCITEHAPTLRYIRPWRTTQCPYGLASFWLFSP